MAQAIYRTITTHTGTSDALIPVDWQQSPFNLAYAVEVPGGVTTSYTVKYTLDDVNDAGWTPVYLADPTNPSAQTGSAGGVYTAPIRALQINVSALSGGTIRVAIIQGSSAR